MGQHQGNSRHILVVDDNPGDRRLAEAELVMMPIPYRVTGAESLRDAFALLGTQIFDAALLDMGLPDCGGLETVQRFIAFAPDLPVVVLTGMNDHQVGDAAVAAGAQDYLVKGEGGGETLHRALSHAIQRKASERQLRESEMFQRAMLQHSPVGVSVTANNGEILFANDRLASIVGVPLEQLKGTNARALYSAPQEREALVARVLRGETVDDCEVCIHGQGNGEQPWVLLSMRATVWEGQPAILTWVYDISSRKTYENTLRQSRDDAEALAQARSEFVGLISHEIRTPMTGILGTVRLLLDSTLDEAQRDWAETISYSGEALVSVLDDIVDFSKLDGGRSGLEEAPFDLRRTIESVISLMSSRADEKGLRMSYRSDKALPRLLVGDAQRLRQILLNLIGNAIKFTSHGEVVIAVDDAGWDSQGRSLVRFMVSDTGPGIRQSELPRLFTGEKSLAQSSTRLHGGGGLGLSICSRLCQLMGGRIGVDSTLGRGASFWIELPLATAGRQEHHAFQQATQFKDSALSVPLEPAASLPIDQEESAKQRVLLVEDNLVNRKVVGGLLERQGYQVDTVVDGVEAVEACEATVFDAILMDIQMPRMDGLEATRTIRALGGRHARVPIIALTANVMLEDSRECLDAGMDAFLSKPVKPQVLYDAVGGQISRARSLAMLNDREAGLDAAGRASKPLVPPVQELVGRTLDALRGDLGDDLLAELLADFMAQAGQAADLLQTLKFSGGAPTVERDQLRRSCHDLRATAQNCGLMQLAVLSAELEQVFCCGDLPKAAKINDFSAALEAARNRLVEHFPPLKGLLWA